MVEIPAGETTGVVVGVTMWIHKLKEFFSSVTHVVTRTQSIRRRESGFGFQDGGRELAVQLSEVVNVAGTKAGKVTYDENYLILLRADGVKLPVGELADGFAEFEQAIYESLRGFPRQWRATVEKAPAGDLVDLWTREPLAPAHRATTPRR